MIAVLEAGRAVRFLWRMADDRDRASLLVLAWFAGLTIVSMVHSAGLDALIKCVWLAGLAVIAWGQLGALTDRITQRAITDEFMSTLGQSPVLYDYAGTDHDYVYGSGWRARQVDES